MKKLDLVLSGILIMIGGLVYIMISQLPKEASIYPIFVTSIFLILSITLLIKTYFNKEEDSKSTGFKDIQLGQLLFILISSGIYILLMNLIGYVVSTILYVFTILFFLKVGKKRSTLISFGFCIFVYILFKILLKVPLPEGIII